jgi:ribose 5-phosphate isomerase B
MRVVIGAPANGAVLKEDVRVFLEHDDRVSSVIDLSAPDVTYPDVSFRAARAVVDGEADRAVLVCGTGVGTAIAACKVRGARAATAHDLITVRGAVENYDAQILCLGQNVIAPAYARALVDLWLDLRHDPSGSYGPKVREIDQFESRAGADRAERTCRERG